MALFIQLVQADFGLISIEEALSKPDINVNHQDENGYTALYYAIKNVNIDTVNLLLSRGADITIKYNDRETLLDLINKKIKENPSDDKLKIIERLLQKSCNKSLNEPRNLEEAKERLRQVGNELKERRKKIADATDLEWIKEEIKNEIYDDRIPDNIKCEIQQKFESEIEDVKDTLDEILGEVLSEISNIDIVFKYVELCSDEEEKMDQTSQFQKTNKYNYETRPHSERIKRKLSEKQRQGIKKRSGQRQRHPSWSHQYGNLGEKMVVNNG